MGGVQRPSAARRNASNIRSVFYIHLALFAPLWTLAAQVAFHSAAPLQEHKVAVDLQQLKHDYMRHRKNMQCMSKDHQFYNGL
ncbi:unnamed protein product [Urochloa humidicola]